MGNYASSDSACEKEIIWETDEENEEADGEGDAFVFLKNNISKSRKRDSECFNGICENKEYIRQDFTMKKLVRDYVDNSLETSKFYRELSESLGMEKARHIALAHALENPSSETPNMVQKYMTLNYFTDIDSKIETLIQRHERTRTDLEDKYKKLKSSNERKTIWSFISRALSAAARVLKGLEKFLGTSPAAAAVHFCSETIELCNARVVKCLNQCKANTRKSLLITNIMNGHTSASVLKLKNTGELVGGVKGKNPLLNSYVEPSWKNGELCLPDSAAMEIKKIQVELIKNLDFLCEYLNEYMATLFKQREELLWA